MFRTMMALAVALSATAAFAQEKKEEKKKAPEKKAVETFTDVEKAGPDFKIQGEYEGAIGDKEKLGAQVVALGDSKFDVWFLKGGLPGAGWDSKYRRKADAFIKDGKVLVYGGGWDGAIADGRLDGKGDGDRPFELKRVERKSPTLGEKPPAGAVVLFDGTAETAALWNGGKLTEGNLLNMGVKSKQGFKDFKVHIEFRLPFMPRARGQGRANSGVYLQDRYELQILDSFGLDGKNNECGGFYQAYDPKPNMCLPPLVWQTYDIEFKSAKFDSTGKKTENARCTVRHNGVVVQDNVEFTKGPTPGGQKEADTPGVFQFQNHGNPVVFRNVWVVEVK
jgi:hypothetical protein